MQKTKEVPSLECGPVMGFSSFRDAVGAQFARMTGKRLYRAAVDKGAMWNTYLAAWPDGTNVLHKTRAEHDCQACRQFIRAACWAALGVALVDRRERG